MATKIQTHLEGTGPERHPTIHPAALELHSRRKNLKDSKRRCDEQEAHVMALMESEGKKLYAYGPLRVEVTGGQTKLKVKMDDKKPKKARKAKKAGA